MYKPMSLKDMKSPSKGSTDDESRKYVSTKFSSSKLLKDQDFLSIKKIGNFDQIEEVPESSFNSSMNSNAFNWRQHKLAAQASMSKGKIFFSLNLYFNCDYLLLLRWIRKPRGRIDR